MKIEILLLTHVRVKLTYCTSSLRTQLCYQACILDCRCLLESGANRNAIVIHNKNSFNSGMVLKPLQRFFYFILSHSPTASEGPSVAHPNFFYRRVTMKQQRSGLVPILLSTAASLSVCILLVAFATDDQPAVMMDWGRLEQSQMMNSYKKAITAGDSNLEHTNPDSHHTLDLSEPGRHEDVGMKSAHVKRSSMQEAANELKHLRKVSASVWPSSKPRKHSVQTSAQLLAHYKRISSESLPKPAYHKQKAMTASQELADFKKLSDEVFPSQVANEHSSWHQTAGEMLAHYKKLSNNAMPRNEHQARKPVETAQQELAHLKSLSAKVLPSDSQSSRSVRSLVHPSQARRRMASPLRAAAKKVFAAPRHAKALSAAPLQAKAAAAAPATRTIAGGLQITDIKVGSGPEPEVGQNIKVRPCRLPWRLPLLTERAGAGAIHRKAGRRQGV